MTDHIYGRKNILAGTKRPYTFMAELLLYIDYLKEQLEEDFHTEQFAKRKKLMFLFIITSGMVSPFIASCLV